ncbi:MAG: serine/threonine-protein kinase [Candidatus Eisenbacteria bacterium]|nr:serine/threonine-protein kinase [Candidatus Eisenbacteria bacterium]
MALAVGTRLGPYEILAPLGAGGMGEVYRARDMRLGREVAIKVLAEHLSADTEVRTRFEREARTVSSLNHPNICTLFDVGHATAEAGSGAIDYLVLELVEGETLAERLRRGALPGGELVRIGIQMADALDRAHRAGVIHRDLKPGNIMLTRSGAKLMDFGLARAAATAASGGGTSGSALTQSPTVGRSLTAEGTIVGTFQYMAPEQLEGREADARSDLWALGCVLYEMATGRRAFEGRSQASLIAAILEREPAPIAEAPPGVPSGTSAPPQGLERVIRNCLAKDPEERSQAAHDVRLQLQGIAENAGGPGGGSTAPAPATAAATPAGGGRSAGVAWSVAALALGGAALFGWVWPRIQPVGPDFRFNPATDAPGVTDANWPRVSPDGRSLLFQSSDSTGLERAWVLPLDDTKPRLIAGAEGLQRAYWSPDSREIAFVAQDKLQRLPVAGGSAVIVCPAPGGSDLSWGSKGMILLDGETTDSLSVVPAGGGELRPATRIDRADREVGSAWPCFLPDGEHFLFAGTRSDGTGSTIRLGRLGSLDSKLLGRTEGRVEYAPGGWVLFVRGFSLLAQKLDVGAARLRGEPITLVDDLRVGPALGNFSVSANGVLAFARSAMDAVGELHVADRAGSQDARVLARGTVGNPAFSPDGRRVLFERRGGADVAWGDVEVLDLVRGTDTRLTFTGGSAVGSAWSPDGRRFAYTRIPREVPGKVVIGSADGLGEQDSLDLPATGAFLSQWSPDGKRLVAFSAPPFRALCASLEGGDRAFRPLGERTSAVLNPRISPDGRWLAATYGVSPNFYAEVWSLAGPPGRWQISNATGRRPVWTKGGREIIYEGLDGRLMAVEIDTTSGFHAGTPKALFPLPLRSFDKAVASWGCDASGERFLLVTRARAHGNSRGIEVVTRFQSLVNRK